MDFIKLFELVTKFAWPALACTACILFMPADVISANWTDFRGRNLLELQATFFISAIVSAGTLFPSKAQVWRYALCPLKKLFFPIVDPRSGLKQSRMRYQRVAVPRSSGEQILYVQVNSNGGGPHAFYDASGKRAFPDLSAGYRAVDNDWSSIPTWGKIDYGDLFNGELDTGTWALVER